MNKYDRNQDNWIDNADNARTRKKLKAINAAKRAREVEDTSGIKIVKGAHGTLSKIQDMLFLSDKACDYEIAAATMEFCCSTALLTLDDAISGTKTPTKVWDTIQTYQKELYVKDSIMKEMMISNVIHAFSRSLHKWWK